jgi:hypothetical protein
MLQEFSKSIHIIKDCRSWNQIIKNPTINTAGFSKFPKVVNQAINIDHNCFISFTNLLIASFASPKYIRLLSP